MLAINTNTVKQKRTCACKNVENIGRYEGPGWSIMDEARMPFKNSEAWDPTIDKIDLCGTEATVGTFLMILRRIGGVMFANN